MTRMRIAWFAGVAAVIGACEPQSAERPEAAAMPTVDKLSVPQNDLEVSVDGFRIIPPMGLGSWAAFGTVGDTTLVMGDLVVREPEVGPVERAVVSAGLTVTGLHNHFVRAEPPVLFMHIRGHGADSTMRAAVRRVFDRIAELRGRDPGAAPAPSVRTTLDTAAIARILGHSGQWSNGVYKATVGRPDVTVVSGGIQVTTEMGLNTWAAWQGTPERAAVAGDLVMLADEVAPVIEALVTGGIEVVAVHNHMVHETPKTFFLHYWGVGPAPELARTLRGALERTAAAQ